VQTLGKGSLIWSPLPLEVSETLGPVIALYRLALSQARMSPGFQVTPDTPSVLVLLTRYGGQPAKRVEA